MTKIYENGTEELSYNDSPANRRNRCFGRLQANRRSRSSQAGRVPMNGKEVVSKKILL